MKVSAALVSKHAPSFWSWLLTKVRGKNLLIIGPGGSGKSSFVDYLLDGELRPPTDEHVITTGIEEYNSVTLDVGQDRRLVFRVKSTTEIPGQGNAALHHANMLVERKPDAVLMVLDLKKDVEQNLAWLEMFCAQVRNLVDKGSLDFRKINAFIISLNKADLIESDEFIKIRHRIRVSMQNNLTPCLSRAEVDRFPILPCISVRTEHGKEK